ncbi:lysylphosphatidylglycerol synthase transmembrane domain-containing protein [Mesorhizobium sp. AaZ16]|uniref:lysylphosphatidylglycerol synthase transmembrane domain-containing protein n=1 Tax=Mesorhizobium sp. AaZ16 TaxID=3402289 RepID=UPI00374E2D28
MIRRLAILALALAMTISVVWLLVTPQTLAALKDALVNADWRPLGFAFVLSAVVQWLRAWRFAVMTTATLGLPGRRIIRIAFQLNFFNFALPFRLGELSYPILMRRAFGQPLLRSTGILLAARLLDLTSVTAVLLAAAATLGLAGNAGGNLLLAAGSIACVMAPAIFTLAIGRHGKGALKSPFLAGIAGRLAPGFTEPHKKSVRLLALALSYAIWLTFAVLAMLCANAVTDGISPAVALLGAAASNLAFALPVNGIAGLGPSQAAWVLAVTRTGVPWESAVVSAMALYAVTLCGAIIFGGIATLSETKWRADSASRPDTR